MVDRVINTKKIEEAEVVILSAPYENGVSFMGGTSKAPQKIIDCLNNNVELFDIDYSCEPAKKIKIAEQTISGIKRASAEKMIKKINEDYERLFNADKFTIMLGGEHTISLGALTTISKKENAKDITIFQIDAHQDLRDDNSDYNEHISKYAHSCVMRRAHELGYNLVQVGIRTFSKYEHDFSEANKETIKVFQWNKNNKIPEISEIISSIKTNKVYLSIDVDGIDPSSMPGTGTPVQGGLEWDYTLNLLETLIKEKEVIGADIVEVCPMRDSVLTEYGSALLCYKIIAHRFRNKFSS